jgi:hypothetical protein
MQALMGLGAINEKIREAALKVYGVELRAFLQVAA